MRVVLDNNVLLSGLMLPESIPGKIVRAWRITQFDLVLSDEMLEEIGRVLNYKKIKKRLQWDEDTIANYLLLLRIKAVIVNIHDIKAEVPADPQDTFILSTMIAGSAEYLATGDNDLLALRDQYAIVTPAEFAVRL